MDALTVADADPFGVAGSAEFVVLLRRRRAVAGLSYRDLARRARWAGDLLPPSTVATMLRRSTLPSHRLVAAYVRACGGDDAEVTAWLAARARIAAAAAEGVRTPDAETSRSALALVVPRQLPPETAHMVGRWQQLAELDAASDGPGPALIVVTGPPGVGKSTLAISWAHRARERFPDGQLYVDLGDDGRGEPLSPRAALSCLLAALGVPPDAVPAAEQQAAALFRSLVADRRLLVLLDGAVSAQQVRLLRPGGPRSCTVVTSQDRLVGLAVWHDARVVGVPCLDRPDGVRVLARAAGDRVTAERAAAYRLVELCDGLPLALRIAAAALDPSAAAPVGDVAAAMRLRGRLGVLGLAGDPHATLGSILERSYRALDDASRRMFRLLGGLPGAGVTVEAAAAAVGETVADTQAVLRRLADRHLVARVADGRYSMLGLLHEYAARLTVIESRGVGTRTG